MHATLPLLEHSDFPSLQRSTLQTLQVNLGYRCNQSCTHCHVNAGPHRTEMMDTATLEAVKEVLKLRSPATLDLTGGAPELHPNFKDLVQYARQQQIHVIDRCNLTVLFEPEQENLACFLAHPHVEVIASLPCYSKDNVDRQRGKGVFEKSIAALRLLNKLGYGHSNSGLKLNLVYNPQGPSLPPLQEKLQADYQKSLLTEYGVVFNALFTITNMPIQRFGSVLISQGKFDSYMQLLKDNFCSANLEHVMCRNLISVDWQGNLYDCDFNQQLGLGLHLNKSGQLAHLRDLIQTTGEGLPIRVADHCFGCTAGSGSSCGGALQEPRR